MKKKSNKFKIILEFNEVNLRFKIKKEVLCNMLY